MSRFQTTRWSLILASREPTAAAHDALGHLCAAYRPAVLAYLRARGHAPDAAEDLTQGFFERFLERRLHESADPGRGRFRALLRTALDRYVIDCAEQARAAKRGGAAAGAEAALDDVQLASEHTPERAFETAWALTLLQRALDRLEAEARDADKAEWFAQLREFLVEKPAGDDYARAAQALALRPNTVAVAVRRLRQRLRELVCEEMLDTLADATELDDEQALLHHALGRR
jgi:RNA polymerase sigma-70 factor (ECF subfamily)